MKTIKAGCGVIQIGRILENEYRTVAFDVAEVLQAHPGVTFTVLHKRPQDQDAYPVPAANVRVEGGVLYWTLTAADLTYEGTGECEIVATDGDVVAKSRIWTVLVEAVLDGNAEPPAPWEGWISQVTDAADRAEAAAELLENPGAEAETLTAGSEATARYEDGTFYFGIPRGQKGNTGAAGRDGFSPAAAVSKSGDTATITITDKNGTTTAEISDGQDGADGFSPAASVSKSGTTATITITDKSGTTTAEVSDGEDGYTPQRGTDYWTAEDQAVIISAVEDAVEPEISEVKSAIDGKAPCIFRDASGDIVTISDGADGMPLSSCVVSIDPVQAAGTPSPENPLPISGWTGASIKKTGRNLLPTPAYTDVKRSALDSTFCTELNAVVAGRPDAFIISGVSAAVETDSNVISINVNYTDGTTATKTIYRGANHVSGAITGPWTIPLTSGKTVDTIHMGGNTGSAKITLTNLQLEHGSTAHAYEAYAGTSYPVSWQTEAGTVYGGTLEPLTGILTVTRAYALLNVSENWSEKTGYFQYSTSYSDRKLYGNSYTGLVSSYYKVDSVDYTHTIQWSSASGYIIRLYDDSLTLSGIQTDAAAGKIAILYDLAEPLVYQLTPVEITTLRETNLWADTGAVAVTYPADTHTYVDSAITAATDPDGNVVTVAGSTPSITGVSGKRYICGTVDSISITPPQTGIIDVVFSSGTTPTVLTASGVVWPGWFNPNSLNASTVYDITIKDGYGVVNTWS